MDPAFRERIETVFHAARQRPAGAERAAYLDGACDGDADLRSRVDALLAADDEAEDFLEDPAVEGAGERPGSSIGPYKLLQEIGEGGMGVVYMAEQQRPVARKVALKVIKLGMDTRQVIARFEAERQALALMDHPNIARVLDAGTTAGGRPFFVMELVRGIAIDEYCNTHKLPAEERLELFVAVCRAVQHAHQKGIIHRDLKPSNVLVTSHDGLPVPKIIDFGVAKATNRRLTERTLFTEFRQVIGTPEYMSPEQAEMSGLDVDTRSDIYALGVLLYKLLTGTTPVDPKALRTAGFEEMTRMIRENEAPAPSTRISKLGLEGEAMARRMGSDTGALARRFRGELDWIVLKALEKDRTRRYETAASFAADVVRYLEDRPVEAGPVSTGYRLRKFVHRNRKAVAAASVVLLALALGLAGTTWGFLSARSTARHSQRVSDSLQDVLAMTDSTRASDPQQVEAVLATVREVFGEEHATYAAVLETLADRLHDAGDFAGAVELGREALAVWKRVHGPAHPNVAMAQARLGSLLRLLGEVDEAEQALREALALLDGAADAPGLAGHEARLELADLLTNKGRFEEADALFEQALVRLRASPTTSRARILATLEKRFQAQLNTASEGAIATLREIYDEAHAFYEGGSPLIAMSALGLGNYLAKHGQPQEAEGYLREALERLKSAGIETGMMPMVAYEALFQIVRTRKDPDSVRETDEFLRQTIELARPAWSGEILAENLSYLGERMLERGRYGDALDAIYEGHAALVDDGAPPESQERLRRGLTNVALQIVLRPGLDVEVYGRARRNVEQALQDEPDDPAMLAVLAATLYREGDLEQAAETFALLDGPLTRSSSRLARNVAPADRGFHALTLAQLGQAAEALAELEAFRAGLEGKDLDATTRAFAAEVEDVVQRSRSSEDEG
jgi:serine/threonine protein kinase